MVDFRAIALTLTVMAAGGYIGPALADPLERYAELQAVGEAINDPDPLMRLALLEEIIAKGDATEVQLAIRTAFTIDDPNIRSLALRAHFASFRTVLITAGWPAEIKTLMDAGETNLVERNYGNHVDFMGKLGGVFSYRTEYQPSDTEFLVQSLNVVAGPKNNNTGFGNIKGALITLQSVTHLMDGSNTYNCKFEFSEYVGFSVKGVGSCDLDETLAFPVTLHLFEPDDPAS